MTARELYYAEYRLKRLNRKPVALGAFREALNHYFSFELSGKKYTEYSLINRYEKKLSKRLKNKRARLQKIGKKQGEQMLKNLISSENPFLKLIPKTDFQGANIVVPIDYGKSLNG